MKPVTAAEILELDENLEVKVIAAYAQPEVTVWQAAKCDYSERPVHYRDLLHVDPGKFIVEELLANERGHWGPLEHPHITFSVAGFVHSVMVQARTHRIGVSFDVQSQRYTGKRVIKVANDELGTEEVFYFRPPGLYLDRMGKKYEYTKQDQLDDMFLTKESCRDYKHRIEERGFAEEHARDQLPQNIRQNFVVTFNLRSVLHFLDLRAKRDAQVEIQALCEALAPSIKNWAPNVWDYYEQKRLHKARLSP